jgi:hypothetical protein
MTTKQRAITLLVVVGLAMALLSAMQHARQTCVARGGVMVITVPPPLWACVEVIR